MSILTVSLIVVAIVSLLRVEHLIASDAWIVLRGRHWRDLVFVLDPEDWEDKQRIWDSYRLAGGGKCPWLFFGIKSYRLAAWSHARKSRRAAMGIAAVRAVWRYFTFAPAMAVLVTTLAFTPAHLQPAARYALLTIAASTMLGMVAVAAEGTLAAFVLESWAVDHHRMGRKLASDSPAALRELAVILGCFAIALAVCYGLVAVIATRFAGYSNFPSQASIGSQLRFVFQRAIPVLTGNVLGGATNASGVLSEILLLCLYFAYFVILLAMAGQKLLK